MPITLPKLSSSDKKKAYALLALFGLLAIVVVWNVLPIRKPAPARAVVKPTDGRVKNSDLTAKKDDTGKPTAGAADVEVLGPIAVLPPIVQVSTGAIGAVRNIFSYPPPPPPKVEPPPRKVTPPPPTINLGSVNPTTVFAGTPRALTVTLMGSLIPRDAQARVDDRPVPSQRVSDNVLKVTLSAAELAAPRTVKFSIRSASQPDNLWSVALPLQIVPSPDPSETFIYTGRVGPQAVLTFKDDRRPKLVQVGDVINGTLPWKVVSVSDKQVELLDTRNDIKKVLPLAPKGAK